MLSIWNGTNLYNPVYFTVRLRNRQSSDERLYFPFLLPVGQMQCTFFLKVNIKMGRLFKIQICTIIYFEVIPMSD